VKLLALLDDADPVLLLDVVVVADPVTLIATVDADPTTSLDLSSCFMVSVPVKTMISRARGSAPQGEVARQAKRTSSLPTVYKPFSIR